MSVYTHERRDSVSILWGLFKAKIYVRWGPGGYLRYTLTLQVPFATKDKETGIRWYPKEQK